MDYELFSYLYINYNYSLENSNYKCNKINPDYQSIRIVIGVYFFKISIANFFKIIEFLKTYNEKSSFEKKNIFFYKFPSAYISRVDY